MRPSHGAIRTAKETTMYDRYKIIVTRDSDQRLLRLFMAAYDALSEQQKLAAPTVVAR